MMHALLPMAREVDPAIKKLKAQQKINVNRRIALELVHLCEEGRERSNRDAVREVFDRYKMVYGEALVDRNTAYHFGKQILEGNAGEWLPLMLNFQVTSSCSQSTTISGLSQDDAPRGPAVKKKGGRPKGTTNATKEDYNCYINEAMKCATEAYITLRNKADKKVSDWQNFHFVEGNRIEVQFTK